MGLVIRFTPGNCVTFITSLLISEVYFFLQEVSSVWLFGRTANGNLFFLQSYSNIVTRCRANVFKVIAYHMHAYFIPFTNNRTAVLYLVHYLHFNALQVPNESRHFLALPTVVLLLIFTVSYQGKLLDMLRAIVCRILMSYNSYVC